MVYATNIMLKRRIKSSPSFFVIINHETAYLNRDTLFYILIRINLRYAPFHRYPCYLPQASLEDPASSVSSPLMQPGNRHQDSGAAHEP